MKTFSEACKSVFLSNKAEESRDVALERLTDSQIRRATIIDEVVGAQESEFLAVSMLKYIDSDDEFSFVVCLLNIFAQGVLVGMEMEREEIS